ncbi:MAG: FecR family protein [Thermoanaerobaculia bacterium]
MNEQNERNGAETDERLERLLGLAGTGPEIPEEGALRLKAAVRPVWRATVEARRAKRRRIRLAGGSLAAAAAAAVVGILLLPARPAPPLAPAGVIERVEGPPATVNAPDRPEIAVGAGSVGRDIAPFARIETGDATRVAVRLANGGSLRLDHGSSVLVESPESLTLLRGAAYVDASHTEGTIRIRTPFGTARDIGTRFEVRLEPRAMTVRVRDGIVAVDAGTTTEVRGGTEGVFAPGREPDLRPIASHAREWTWVQEIAPPFALEGRTTAEFLVWVGAETGREIIFSSEAARTRANASVLHGDLAGMTPATAPEIVLPSAGLTVERDDGSLRVSVATREPGVGP